ncbi:MAG: ATPase [Phototrophicales bacterium]|nr:MAG: ATPase [Phototrophicales bacterium]
MTTIRRLIRPEQLREISLLILIVLACIFFSTQINGFLSGRTFARVSTSVAIITVVAVGQTLVVLTRNIDLSVGSIVGFCAYFVGMQFTFDRTISPASAVAMAIGVGALMGGFNGLLVAYARIPAIIVTLGTLAIYRGLLVEYGNARTVTTANLPSWLVGLQPTNLFSIGDIDIRLMVFIAIVVVLVFQLALGYLQFGRRLYAIGSNPDAARIAGIPAQRTVFLAYVICGALAGLGGFMFLVRFGDITIVAAQGLELQVVAAVVVGGVNIFGGSGTMFGAMLGAVMIGTLEYSLTRMTWISQFWKDALLGGFILAAVAADAIILTRIRKLWARTELTLTAPVSETPEVRRAAGD